MASIKRLKYCINNEWLESATSKYMPVMNPSLGVQIAEAPCCTQSEVDAAVKAAAAAFPAWSNTPIPQRIQLMFRFKALLDKNLDELATLLATEMGKVVAEAKGDVLKAIEVVECACASHYLMQGDTCMNVANGYDTVSFREPLGVFVGIAPYNFPAMIPMGWMLPFCITTGNTFVLKAASMVPQTSSRMLELLIEAGLPKGVVNLVTCSRVEADSLLTNPAVKGVTFVGSTSVGLHIYSTAAGAGKRVQALCEAKNHALVMEDCVLERSVAGIINSTYGCAGQRCMALPVVCVQESIADEFIALFKKKAMELKLGPAYDPSSQLGPLVSAAQKQSVENWIQRGVDEGAKLVLDGRGAKVDGCENGYFVGPTIFDNVLPEHSVGNDEIFGPVTCIKRVKDFEEGLAIMNANRFANGSCIYTSSGRHAREFAKRTHGGMVGINVGIPVPFSIFPFTGHKDSFFGDLHAMGKDGVAFFTETKAVTSVWFTEEDSKKAVSTWDGTLTRN
ncbi:MAG: CoA-acylating methylmalonate-semialdehyde dehydrogenase [Propionivibrio sp.]|jgi:malonate-semialdehyde dehydrogenase (acetylating)/methylmalonate-semialdehyde dehydrogenase|uniref:CoA-acylating methylmalonate-semialdehyde dehydrogenase n=1 Tax=Propionivibrio sp. TaxID=2212460 RepID=UPI001B452987|nr:CoA-acylating methylmalonate-semialdehyde dehydrogenase [Propionivibrio sp.]MBP7203138.1 CoA-acylating methylmalonate-semialdehyde dehydrogenase [Propionivibrio sp.]